MIVGTVLRQATQQVFQLQNFDLAGLLDAIRLCFNFKQGLDIQNALTGVQKFANMVEILAKSVPALQTLVSFIFQVVEAALKLHRQHGGEHGVENDDNREYAV